MVNKLTNKQLNALNNIYSEWLVKHYPEDVTNKEELLKRAEQGYMFEEFIDDIKNEM